MLELTEKNHFRFHCVDNFMIYYKYYHDLQYNFLDAVAK